MTFARDRASGPLRMSVLRLNALLLAHIRATEVRRCVLYAMNALYVSPECAIMRFLVAVLVELLRNSHQIRSYGMQRARQKKSELITKISEPNSATWKVVLPHTNWFALCARKCCNVRANMGDPDAPETAVHFTPECAITCALITR